MKINRIAPNKVTKVYGNNKPKTTKEVNKPKGDSLEISDVGKSLSAYAADTKGVSSKEKIERIRKEISNGTYTRDSKLVAKKLVDMMKNREV